MNTKHTPGPWIVAGENPERDERYITDQSGDATVCAVWMMADDFNTIEAPERDANARLISKAPELRQLVWHIVQCGYLNDEHQQGSLATARDLLAEIDGKAVRS